MTALRISFKNTSAPGGTALTPLFTGFHDNSFDLYDLGQASSSGLEALAEDGDNSVVAAEVTAADADAQTINIVGDRGPVAAGETASAIIDVDGLSNGYASFGSMILPSNDAFIGTASAVKLFDASGAFLGSSTTVFSGTSVRDAGTEENTEQDAAFINQTAPNTGVTEGGVVTNHPGFNGSVGNPGGTQTILGGTNAFGEFIDPVAADFTAPGAQVAEVHINTVVETSGTAGRDVLFTGADDDLIDAGAGRDVIFSGKGWDVVDGGAGRDYIFGGNGDDILSGGDGRDFLFGGRDDDSIDGGQGRDFVQGGSGNDALSGGAGRDFLRGQSGDDRIEGGAGNDFLSGGRGDDTFVFVGGDGDDRIRDFGNGNGQHALYRGDDVLSLDVAGVDSFADVEAAATQHFFGTELDFGDEGSILLFGVSAASLSADDFVFV